MFLYVGGVIMLIVSNVGGQNRATTRQPFIPSDHIGVSSGYRDVFLAGMNGKPTLGTAGSTCWARGGICVDLHQCPSLNMDVGVAGCAWGYKVCCKTHGLLSPTVGTQRRYAIPVINSLDELGTSLEIIALRNSMLLSSWQREKNPETDDVHLEDLLNK
ncbi:uncharacterized protein LOC126910602 [Spodoptera frugiperda]|uniref:Uncharacterized protein LOC126910602 n=1 Tax=Spodoptera frugiperda TaxID=7108 RepID=A0A9R0DU48_SPOFR|nr:uncharacterized protein LOC126910602 [Spodoptera frugiperda]